MSICDKSVNDIVYIFILGYSCHSMKPEDKTKQQLWLRDSSGIDNVHLLCNEDIWGNSFYVAQTCMWTVPHRGEYVSQVVELVEDYWRKDFQVVLVGHSYGGGICCQVAESLNKSAAQRSPQTSSERTPPSRPPRPSAETGTTPDRPAVCRTTSRPAAPAPHRLQ